jgi:hypothetical protein
VREASVNGEEYEVSGPTPEREEIVALIAWCKEHGSPQQRAYLALSTIYAMRAIEIHLVNKKEDIKGDRLFVRTAKGGQPKWHRIPPQVLSSIKKYRYPERTESCVWDTFAAMRGKAGLTKATALTPHGIRRWLNTFFTNHPTLNPYVWKDFARWTRDRRDMATKYRHAKPEDIDQMIFKLHPLLALWDGIVDEQSEEESE